MNTEFQVSTELQPPGFFRRHRHKFIILVGTLAITAASPFLLFFGSIAFDALKERSNRLSFDAATWKASLSATTESDPIRLRMVDDLLHRHKLMGMTHDELTALIGTPPKTNYFRDYQLVYWLGPERGFMSVDSEWLAVRFGPDDRVSEARIVRD